MEKNLFEDVIIETASIFIFSKKINFEYFKS